MNNISPVDRVSLYTLLSFAFVYMIYLSMIAWVLYEFMHAPAEPSTRILLPAYAAHWLRKSKAVVYVKTKVFGR